MVGVISVSLQPSRLLVKDSPQHFTEMEYSADSKTRIVPSDQTQALMSTTGVPVPTSHAFQVD